jgi:hypothetical protein
LIDITLDWDEVKEASDEGVKRQLRALKDGLKSKFGCSESQGEGFGRHILGACAERAFAKFMGYPWSPDINGFHDADVGRVYQVRYRTKRDWDLVIRPGDNPEHIYILIVGDIPTFTLVGWVRGFEGMKECYKKIRGERAPMFYIPQSELRAIRVRKAA